MPLRQCLAPSLSAGHPHRYHLAWLRTTEQGWEGAERNFHWRKAGGKSQMHLFIYLFIFVRFGLVFGYGGSNEECPKRKLTAWLS